MFCRLGSVALSCLSLLACVDTYEEPDFTRTQPPAHPRGASAASPGHAAERDDASLPDSGPIDASLSDVGLHSDASADAGPPTDAWVQPDEPEPLRCDTEELDRNAPCEWITLCLASQSCATARDEMGAREVYRVCTERFADDLIATLCNEGLSCLDFARLYPFCDVLD